MNEEILSAEDFRRIRVEWRAETEDRLSKAHAIIRRMQESTAEAALMKELMRALHSLKGTAAMVGFRNFADFVHHMEDYCDLFRGENPLPPSHFSTELLDEALLHLNEVVEGTTADHDPVVGEPEVEKALQTAIQELTREKAQHFAEPELPPRAPDALKWPVIQALHTLRNTNHGPEPRRRTMDPQRFQEQLQALNQLTIEPCILIVDDEPALAQIVGDLIKNILPRARLIEADSGHKALNLITSVVGDQIDLVIMDLVMPDVTGLHVLKTLHQFKSRGEIFANCIVMTAHKPLESDWHDCLQLGAREFLLKPFGLEELLSCLMAPIREAMLNRLLATIVSYSQRVYLAFNRMERETDPQVQKGIKREVHSMLMLMSHAQKNLQEAQKLPFGF